MKKIQQVMIVNYPSSIRFTATLQLVGFFLFSVEMKKALTEKDFHFTRQCLNMVGLNVRGL